jgi:hypothetical protein
VRYHSQKGQDRWVIEEVFAGKQNGWFLDLAAYDGETMSNTLTLERDLGWTGLAIEAAPEYYALLKERRTCQTCDSCIDGGFRTVEFVPNRELGGIIAKNTDNNPQIRRDEIREWRSAGKTLTLQTVPLAHVLREYRAPAVIDFFSFDVEGAETRILRNFPFDRWRFLSLCIERPTPELNELLFRNGYLFVRNAKFDTFYVHETLPDLSRVKREPFEQVPAKDW